MKQRVLISLGLILVAVIGRWIPHPPNFTPVIAVALIAGMIFKDRLWATMVPLIALVITDSFLGFHSTALVVYPALVMIALGGSFLKIDKASSYAKGGVGGSLFFFLTTNFAVWAMTPIYSKSLAGLMESYVMGLPFFHYTLGSTFLYLAGFFAAQYVLKDRVVLTQKV